MEDVKKGDYARADVLLQRALRQNSSDIDAKYQLALVKSKLHDDATAYALLHELEDKVRQGPLAVPIRVEVAKVLIGAGQNEEAQRRLLWTLDKEPHNKDARTLFASTLTYMSRVDEARKQVDLLLAESPADSTVRVLDMAVHLQAHEVQKAEETLLEEVALTMRSTDSLVALANFYQLTGAIDKSIPLLQEAVGKDPKNIAVRTQLGWEYAAAGDRRNAEKTFRECGAMALATYYVQVGDWPKAIAELEPLVKKTPDVQSRDLLDAVYYRGGRTADAEKLTAQLITENPQDVRAHLLRGTIHLDKREYDPAVAEFEQVLHFESDSAPALYLLALASYGAGKEETALQDMESALKKDAQLLPARLWLIDHHLKSGSTGAALDVARGVPENQRSTPEIVIYKALCNPEATLDKDQQNRLFRALLTRPQFIAAYQNLGMAPLLRKYGTPLREELQAAIAKNPKLQAARSLVLTILEAQGKDSQVVSEIQKHIDASPRASDLVKMATIQMKTRDFRGARANLDKALAIDPGNRGTLARLADLEAQSGNLEAALERLNDLTKRYPNYSDGWSFAAIVHQQRGETQQARAMYEQALKLDDRNAVAANNLAWLLATSFKAAPEGAVLARKAHNIDPGNPGYSDTLGWILYLQGNAADALAPLAAAARLKPGDATYRYHLGMAQSESGHPQEAIESLETARRLNPKMPEAQRIAQELATLRK